ncbi:hypothetical protein E1295_20055 [Nonomuraea mesophila]|uniref:Uncharacterized protein n=1 Tax=Nonomuraea mesophila TaxID=2530382 RepID=A0A4V2ZA43_9ACTN|nr:hypothetical protein [Nonomuraea mesophila]TDE49942.1 hypothetical protein E1295_20055 [Nonomuraea mesophila]
MRFRPRPAVPLTGSALLVNGRVQPEIGLELKRELASADHVDLLCAIVKWNGVRVLAEAIDEFLHRGGRLRVVTTTYIGATDRLALDRLAAMGAEIRVYGSSSPQAGAAGSDSAEGRACPADGFVAGDRLVPRTS